LERAIVYISSLNNSNERKFIKELKDVAKKAKEAGEKRFLPFIDLLENVSVDQKEKTDAEPQPSLETQLYGLIDTVVYYLRTGSIPQETSFIVNGYFDLVNHMERQIRFGHHDLQLAIVKTITEEKTRSRLVMREKEHFLQLITKVLFPAEFNDLMVYKTKILQLLKQKWTEVSISVLNEIFYLKIFEQVIEKQSPTISASDLITNFIQFAKLRLNRELYFARAELKKMGFSNQLINALTSTDELPEKEKKAEKPKIKQVFIKLNKDWLLPKPT
jgi:hypothetical protein